jgi:hypothetical protein
MNDTETQEIDNQIEDASTDNVRHKAMTIDRVGSNQFLSVNIGVIRLLSVITTPFVNYGTSETMFDQKRCTFGLFFHIFAPTTKALFKFFMILKKTVELSNYGIQ